MVRCASVYVRVIDSERDETQEGGKILARDLVEVLLASESRESQSVRLRYIIMTIPKLRSMGQTSLSTSFLLR